MKRLRAILIVIFTALLLFSAYKIYAYISEARESAASVEALIEKAVKERAPQEPGSQPESTVSTAQEQGNQPENAASTAQEPGDQPGDAASAPQEPGDRPGDNASGTEAAPIAVDFEALRAEAPDIAAWLYCPDTVVNYPVAQAEDNEYYLHRLTDGSRNAAGTLFLDYRCDGDFTGWNHIIYGHNMKNGSMFAVLSEYGSQAYYDGHPAWYLLTPEQNYRVDILAGFETPARSEFYSFPQTREERDAMIQSALEQSDFIARTGVRAEDRLVIFSTCSYAYDSARYVVMGLLREIG